MVAINDSQSSGASPARRRRLPVLLGAVIVVLAGLSVLFHALPTADDQPARHLIVISLDTTRADHFGCYGNTWIRTPRIDALAAESILLTDYMTVIPTTLASHTTLFTGKYPHTHGVPRNGFVVHDDNVMLAETLEQAGFHTAAFLASFALHSRFNFAQGFDHVDEAYDIRVGDLGADQNQRRAAAITDAVIDYLDRRDIPPNLFLFVHYFDPHVPYDPPPPYDTMYGETAGAIKLQDHPATAFGDPPPEIRRILYDYTGEVSYMDHHVGRLLDDLRRRGILDHALLVVTSDHGECLGDTVDRRVGHGSTVYECELRSVAMFRLPNGAQGGRRLDLPAASIDVLPTVLDYVGLTIPSDVEGDVLDLAGSEPATSARTRFAEASKPRSEESDASWFNDRKARCVRQGQFKYIQTPYRATEELYDLSADPLEQRNLLGSFTPEMVSRAAELRRQLAAWTAMQNPLPTHFDQQQRDETVRRLRALGYLVGEEEEDADGQPP
jgi:arylsulfatase A-like enzyme